MADYDIQDGATILLQPKLASGFISHPNSFQCDRLRGGEKSRSDMIFKLCDIFHTNSATVRIF